MASGGFYLMHRGWQDHPVFRGEAFSRRDAFVWMIEEAAFRERRVATPKGEITLERGQFSHSLRYMARAWKWEEPRVRRFLTSLQNAEIIDATTDAGQTVIKLRNYAKYQAISDEADAPTDAPATQQRRTTDAKKKELETREDINSDVPDGTSPRARKRAAPMSKPDDVEDQVWDDFVRLRAKQGAPPTPTAIAGINREAAKLGWTLNQALTECCERSWRGFKADWVKQGNGRNGTARNGNGQAGGSGDGFLDGIREARANLAARGRQTDDDRGMPYFGGMG